MSFCILATSWWHFIFFFLNDIGCAAVRIRLGNHETSNTTGRTNYKNETVSDYNYAIRDSLSHYTAAIQRGLFSPYSSCCGGQRPLIRVEGRRHGGDRVRKCAVFLKWTGALNIVNGTKKPKDLSSDTKCCCLSCIWDRDTFREWKDPMWKPTKNVRLTWKKDSQGKEDGGTDCQ